MATSRWDEDDDLLEELRSALRSAGAPTAAMREAGSAAYSWLTVDAELAVLTYDSLVDHADGVRGSSGPRDLVFEGERMSVEVEHDPACLVGQTVPPGTGEAALIGPGPDPGEVLAQSVVDELGRFRFERSVTGLVRLRCSTPSGALLTEWFRL